MVAGNCGDLEFLFVFSDDIKIVMGGKSSKKQQVKNDDIWKDIPTSGHSIPRSAPTSGRGTSTSPSEAWERGSEDFNGRDQHEWFNSTNSSYNLLDLQVHIFLKAIFILFTRILNYY